MAKTTTKTPSKPSAPEEAPAAAPPGANVPATVEPGAGAISLEVAAFEDYAGAGTEHVTSNDVLIPRLSILQGLSPQIKKSKPEYIEGAEVGQICDVGVGDVFPDGVLFLPVYYRKDWLEWAPRASGKGLIRIHRDDAILSECSPDAKGRPFLPNGNYIAETAQWYGLNLTAGNRKCFIPMASSALKRSRKWMTLVMGEKLSRKDGSTFPAPIFYRAYDLSTAEESNEEGEWSTWS